MPSLLKTINPDFFTDDVAKKVSKNVIALFALAQVDDQKVQEGSPLSVVSNLAPMYGKFLSLVSKAVKDNESDKVSKLEKLFGLGVSKIVELSLSKNTDDKTVQIQNALKKAQKTFSETHKNPLAVISDEDLNGCCDCCTDCTLFAQCGCGCKK